MTTITYKTLDDSLIDQIVASNEQNQWLIIEDHPDFQGAWYVGCLDPQFFFYFEDIIGSHSVLFPHQLEDFQARAYEEGYRIAFTSDPTERIKEYEALNEPPPFSIASSLDGTTQGFLPWQIAGFNKLIRPSSLRGGLCLWDTGTGKTVFVAMGILWHVYHQKEADLALVVVKSNNKRDMQKKLKKLADIDSIILDGTIKKRNELYLRVQETKPIVVVMNYEKFREDQEFWEVIVAERNVVAFWDEMPTKLSNRGSQLYQAVRSALFDPDKRHRWKNRRPQWLRQYELTATPIETDPGNQFNCVRLIDPEVLGTATAFEAEHVLTRNPFNKKPSRWVNVDKMGHRLNFMTHRVDKTQPEVAKYFPETKEDNVLIDWHPRHRRVYDQMTAMAAEMLEEGEDVPIFSLIMVLRMLCDAPSMVQKSAGNREMWSLLLDEAIANQDESLIQGIPMGSAVALKLTAKMKGTLTDDGHTKLDRLYEDLMIRHPDSKVVIFSTFSGYIQPVIAEYLDAWGVSYVTYAGTQKQRDEAKDYWRTTPECRVLISSDAGSDSIDLPEAQVIINYDLPSLWSRKTQRINRGSRADSIHDTLYVYNYLMADSIEERWYDLLELRHGYHQDFTDSASKESSALTKGDLVYAITG